MADPALPSSLAAVIADLDRRLRNVERSPQLGHAAITDGVLSVYDGSGNLVGYIGEAAAGEHGLRVRTTAGSEVLRVSAENLLAYPYLHIPARQAGERLAVTAGSFTTAWRATHHWVPSKDVRIDVTIVTDAGTTGDVRVYDGSGAYTAVQSVAAGASVSLTWRWIHGREFTNTTFEVQAQRTGGAGNVYVYEPVVSLGDVSGATATGV